METQHIKMTQLRIDVMTYFKECADDDLDGLKNKYSETELDETFKWIMQNGWFEKCQDGYKLNIKGQNVIQQTENKVEQKNSEELQVTKKEIEIKFWDRLINNGYKLIGIPILIWTAILQYNQVGNSADITRLQEKLKADSIQFSTTLRDLQNQSVRHDSMLERTKIYIVRQDSLVNSLRVDKQRKKK